LGRIYFHVTDFADKIDGDVEFTLLLAQLVGDGLGPLSDAAAGLRIGRSAGRKALHDGLQVCEDLGIGAGELRLGEVHAFIVARRPDGSMAGGQKKTDAPLYAPSFLCDLILEAPPGKLLWEDTPMTQIALALAAGLVSVGSMFADPQQIDRSIAKEPVYRTAAPKYGLLMFGPEGKDRVWIVLDGDTLYVDRNGNGDLTEPGEKVAAEKTPGRDPEDDGYSFDVGEVTVGGRTHLGLSVYFVPLKRYGGDLGKRPDVKAALAKDPKAMAVRVGVDVKVPGLKGGGLNGRVGFLAGPVDLNGPLVFSDTPAQAPAIYFGSPLQVTFYSELPTLRVGRGSEFVLVVGTPGVGPGTFAMVCYQDTIPASVKPVAVVTFQLAKPGDAPPKERFEIKDRC